VADGPDAIVSLSCASGVGALAVALEWMRAGKVDRALAGGFDELSETAFAGLSALRAISRDTIRPFDKDRDGAIFSEGAAVFALESGAAFRARGGDKPLAWLAGRGLTNDAHHMTAPETTGAGVARAMRMAIADAGLPPEAISHVNLHGTGTPYNDKIETLALETVFGAHTAKVVCTANKSLFGHAMGAAGALEAAATVLALRHGLIPPTIHCREKDPALGLDVAFSPREGDFRAALKNSYGLGGANAVAVLARAD
jgi:3-oxoacyl-[acyl-carrier-protein] synthase II